MGYSTAPLWSTSTLSSRKTWLYAEASTEDVTEKKNRNGACARAQFQLDIPSDQGVAFGYPGGAEGAMRVNSPHSWPEIFRCRSAGLCLGVSAAAKESVSES